MTFEQKQGVVTDRLEAPVVGAALTLTVNRRFAGIHVGHDAVAILQRPGSWDRVIVDRSGELREWVNVVYKINGSGVPVFAYAKNHYAGHAPATVELFRELWKEKAGRDRGLSSQRFQQNA